MCRLFGMLAAEPVAARFGSWVPPIPCSTSPTGTPTGTGLAHYVSLRPVVEKHPVAAHEDREFAAEACGAHSHLFVAHVRHTSRGEPRPENTQPFSPGSLVFAHNGTVDGLKVLLPGSSSGLLLGDTDSERYFALLHHHIREDRDTITDTMKAVYCSQKCCIYTSLNFVLADGDYLYALRLPDTERPTSAASSPRKIWGPQLLGDRTESHVPQGAVLFASERIDPAPSWRELKPGTLAVARHDLRLETCHG
jgi:predicted glutamine amidotransferase